MADMRIADFLRHDAQAYGVPGAPSIERILEVCVKAANWIDNLEGSLEMWKSVASSPGAVEDMARENYRIESTYGQVSKALCGKKNAPTDELLQAVDQLKNSLAHVERERDAAVKEWKRTKMDSEGMCWTCKHGLITDVGTCRCSCPDPCDEGEEWEWRGVCEENTKEDENA